MSAIGAAEDAYGAAVDALAQLDNAVDCMEAEGWCAVTGDLRRLRDELDNITNQLGLWTRQPRCLARVSATQLEHRTVL